MMGGTMHKATQSSAPSSPEVGSAATITTTATTSPATFSFSVTTTDSKPEADDDDEQDKALDTRVTAAEARLAELEDLIKQRDEEIRQLKTREGAS